eukprot:CAMPEP_0184518046 /NCGR_PEP_ID=MMETSP0198_2-20121128/5878_1 /TAXON_ID=1112570 /ORGANISM="Thraustochytrium sp., Strain LLF1b" /LENGTH=137 /DNA_ID=CAMNT_0026908457 /DNA_START=451 /DNA_END=865 /DNA_ORIENTATION=+
MHAERASRFRQGTFLPFQEVTEDFKRGQRRAARTYAGVFEDGLRAHHRIGVGHLEALEPVFVCSDTPVRNHWDAQRLFYLADNLPIGFAGLVLLLLLCATVYSEKRAAAFLEHFGKFKRALEEDTDLARHWYCKVLG